MLPRWPSLIVALQATLAIGATVLLPELGGPYKVGTTAIELIDHSRTDPLAPTPQPRDLMVSFFYPTTADTKNLILTPAFPPQTAAFLDAYFGIPPGIAASVTTRAYHNAPLLRHRRQCQPGDGESHGWPVLLFGPGFGGSRLEYSAQVSELASRGFFVAVLDHPYDTSIVEYPDGRMALANLTRPLEDYPGGIVGALNIRVKDFRFVLDSLTNMSSTASLIPGMGASNSGPAIDLRQVGVLGHSFGGAASAQAMYEDARFAAGIDEDGTLFGPVSTAGLARPFLILAAENTVIANDTNAFWDASTGEKWFLRVNGTTHGSFVDHGATLDILGPGVVPPELRATLGTIKGARMLEIEGAYVASFFRRFLEGGKGRLLEGESERFPEVVFDRKKG